jgi:hypothetical protein
MPGSRRLRTVAATVGLMLLLGGVPGGTGQPAAHAAVPRFYQFDGGGYGHGIGMRQYGAYGMGLRGVSAGRIIGYYYRGAQARPASLPAGIRVGLLQASLGGRRVRVPTILGHRSTSYTDCPGSPTIALLPTIRAAVARTGLPKIYGGTASRSWVAPGRSSPVTIGARLSSVANWRLAVTGSNGAVARGAWTGRGSRVAVAWNGQAISGAPAPAGWATMTLTASAGGRSARPATIRVYVDRRPPTSSSSTGGFASSVWSVSNLTSSHG